MRIAVLCFGAIAFFVYSVADIAVAHATPRMSATSGAPCATCHYSPDGGGIRTEIGFGNQIDNTAWDYEDLGIGFLAEQDTNYLTDWLAVGADIRIQAARPGRPRLLPPQPHQDEPQVEMADRRIFPMQIEPSVAIRPTDWLTMLGSWTPGPEMPEGNLCSGAYPGQMCGTAQALFEFNPLWPTFRAGLFRPNIGVHHDDHTMLVEADATRSRPEVIPPNYAEAGVEMNYQPRHWFRADAGIYRSDQLAESLADDEMVRSSDPAALARVTFFPSFDFGDHEFYNWAGVSVYGSGHLRGEGDFRMDRAYFGLGMLDRGALMLDVAHLDFRGRDTRRAFNASTTLEVEIYDWLVARGRIEQATTWREATDDAQIRRAAIAGVKIYPIPFVKLQPEYRYTRTNEWHSGQYTVQLHLFF